MAKKKQQEQVMQVTPKWPWPWGIRTSFQSLVALLMAFLVVASVYLRQNNIEHASASTRNESSISSRCNLFSGKWVYDNKSYPLYKERECTFMSEQLACEKFGRKDLNYQFWRWQPHQCDLPRSRSIFFYFIYI